MGRFYDFFFMNSGLMLNIKVISFAKYDKSFAYDKDWTLSG